MQRVLNVDAVDVSLTKSLPPAILVAAHGHVPTTGWTMPALAPWFYIRVPDDGIQDLDFVAKEPTGIVGEVVLPIAAELTIHREVANYWGEGRPLRGFRVHARVNSKDYLIGEGETVKEAVTPISGPVAPPLADNALAGIALDAPKIPDEMRALLIGKGLRVYKTGDILTQDWQPNRFNIERAPVDGHIVNIWFG